MISIANNLAEALIYLDPAFVSLCYESETKISPSTQISNDFAADGKLNFGLASIGGSTKETRTFKLSSFGMLQVLKSRLESYRDFDAQNLISSKSPQTCWVTGTLVTGEWRPSGGD